MELAQTGDIVAKVQQTVPTDTATQLKELADKFLAAARIIDPTITGAWFGMDLDAGPEPGGRLNSVYLERPTMPFVRKGAKS